MATIREHIRVNRPADDVWKILSNASDMSWFPTVEASTMPTPSTRSVTFEGGFTVEEEIVTNDDALRRFQYRLVGGAMPVESHLGTLDVLEDGEASIVIYSTDVQPDGFAKPIQQTMSSALGELKKYLEG
jgi:hypothetical protein